MAAESDIIRDLLVALGAVGADETISDLEAVERAADELVGALDAVVSAGTRVIAGLVGIAAAGTAMAVTAANNAERLQNQAAALNSNVGELQAMGFAFEEVAGGVDLMEQTLFAIQGRAADATAGNAALLETFAQLGISAGELDRMSPGEIFEQMADGVESADDRGKALSATMRLLGEDVARRTAPLLVQGADGIRALKSEARDLGLVMRADTVTATAELAVSWRRLMAVGRELRDTIGAAIAPALTRVIEKILDWVAANDELINERLTLFVEGLTGLFMDWAPIIAVVTTAILGLAVVLGGLMAAAAAPTITLLIVGLTNLAAIATGVALVIEDLNVYLRGGDSLIGNIIERIEEWSPLLAGLIKIIVAVIGAWHSFLGLVGRGIVALAKWGAEWVRFQAQFNPVLLALRELWELINRPFEGGWLDRLAEGITAGGDFLSNVRVPEPGSSSTTNNNNTTNNTRSDVNQTVNVFGGDAEETIASAFRTGREAVAGGIR